MSTCPCGNAHSLYQPVRRNNWDLGQKSPSSYCNQCGAALAPYDDTTGPTAADLAAAYERLLEAHAGTPAACGLDAATWADAARREAAR